MYHSLTSVLSLICLNHMSSFAFHLALIFLHYMIIIATIILTVCRNMEERYEAMAHIAKTQAIVELGMSIFKSTGADSYPSLIAHSFSSPLNTLFTRASRKCDYIQIYRPDV
jgi:hypothetical protein